MQDQTKIRLRHLIAAFRYATLLNLTILPSSLIVIFDCSQGRGCVNFSMSPRFRFDQFGSIVSRGESGALILLDFLFGGWNYCAGIVL